MGKHTELWSRSHRNLQVPTPPNTETVESDWNGSQPSSHPHTSEGKNECVLCALGCAAVHTHRLERMSTTLHLIPLRQGLSSNLGPCWCPGGRCDSPEVTSAPATMPKALPPSCVVTPSKSLYAQQELYISPAPALKFLPKVVSHSS